MRTRLIITRLWRARNCGRKLWILLIRDLRLWKGKCSPFWRCSMGFLSDLFIKKRKYDHIVSLGNNCEYSFQFFTNYKFVEANLFSWVYVLSPKKLLDAIARPDLMFSEGISEPDWLYTCNKYEIKFHGRASDKELLDAEG